MANYPTPHINATPDDFAKTVLMPGDPLRAKFIAENFLTNAKLVNNVRGIQGYTGEYDGQRVSVMASGMGMPSIGIYSYELYNFFEVENIMRIGSAGAMTENIKAIISNAEAILLRNGFKIAYVPSYSDEGGVDPMYIDPTMQYYLYFQTNDEDETDDSAYMTVVLDDGYMSAAIDFNYPTEKIAALTPEDLDDTLPSFEQRGAVYQVNEDTDNTFMLWISPQQGMSANSIVANIQRALSVAEYTPIEGGDGGYVSKNGQIEVYVSVIDEKMVQVYVYFPEPEEPPIEEPIEVTYTLVWDKGNWKDNITDADAKIYAYVWGGEEGDQWIELTPQFNEDGTISFELNITSDYTGVKIVRFSPNSKLGWNGDEGVEIWNQSGDYELNGKGGEILFVVA